MTLIKKLDQYVLKETVPFAFIGFSFFTFLFILEELFRIFELILVRDVAAIKIFKLLFFLLPAFFGMTVPMGILVGVLLGITRLSHDTEIIAFQANGISVYRCFRAIYILGFIASIGMVIFNDRFIPYGNRQYRSIFYSILKEKPTVNFKSKRRQKVGEKYVIIPYKVNPQTGEMTGIYIYEQLKVSGTRKVTMANKGYWLTDSKNPKSKEIKQLRLVNGAEIKPMNRKHEQQEKYKVLHTTFNELIILINPEKKNDSSHLSTSTREKYITDMIKEINQIEQKKKDPEEYKDDSRWRDLQVELMKKFSIPFACFVFAFLGSPLAVSSKRGGKGLGIGFSIIIIFIFYVLWYMGESLGKKKYMDVYTGGWLPDIVLFIAGVIMNIRLLRK
jgi:lipopolysaccharide export LptBFGC system permease protein LptF